MAGSRGDVYVQGFGWSAVAPDRLGEQAGRVRRVSERAPVAVSFAVRGQQTADQQPGWDANGSPVEAA